MGEGEGMRLDCGVDSAGYGRCECEIWGADGDARQTI